MKKTSKFLKELLDEKFPGAAITYYPVPMGAEFMVEFGGMTVLTVQVLPQTYEVDSLLLRDPIHKEFVVFSDLSDYLTDHLGSDEIQSWIKDTNELIDDYSGVE